MKQLLKELKKAVKELEGELKNPPNLETERDLDIETQGRIKAFNCIIVRVQQMLLKRLERKNLKKELDKLTDDERLEVMANYCKFCGVKTEDERCYCMNDD